MKVKISGWITRWQPEWLNNPVWNFYKSDEKPKDSDETLYVQPYTIEAEVPEKDFIAERVAGIEEAKRSAYVACEARIAQLDETKSKLLALEAPNV